MVKKEEKSTQAQSHFCSFVLIFPQVLSETNSLPAGSTTDLVLIHNPALEFLIPALVAFSVLDDLVHAQVLQLGTLLGQDLTVSSFSGARRAGDYDIW